MDESPAQQDHTALGRLFAQQAAQGLAHCADLPIGTRHHLKPGSLQRLGRAGNIRGGSRSDLIAIALHTQDDSTFLSQRRRCGEAGAGNQQAQSHGLNSLRSGFARLPGNRLHSPAPQRPARRKVSMTCYREGQQTGRTLPARPLGNGANSAPRPGFILLEILPPEAPVRPTGATRAGYSAAGRPESASSASISAARASTWATIWSIISALDILWLAFPAR